MLVQLGGTTALTAFRPGQHLPPSLILAPSFPHPGVASGRGGSARGSGVNSGWGSGVGSGCGSGEDSGEGSGEGSGDGSGLGSGADGSLSSGVEDSLPGSGAGVSVESLS